jgi:ferric-dicitrate binding protein FerR (iron transport regulator)
LRRNRVEFGGLVTGAREGTLTEADVAELEALLAADAGLRREYVEAMLLTADLRWECSPREERSAATSVRFRPAARRPMFFGIAAMIILSVVGLMAAALAIQSRMAAPAPSELFATLVDSHNARWDASDVATSVGSQLHGGFLRLRSGTAQVEFFSGAQVTLTGPVEFAINSQKRGFLKSGKIAAYVPQRAKGFTIAAKGCAVVDLGTKFEMEIGPTGEARVQVLSGQVVLEAGGVKTSLAAGQARRVETSGAVTEIAAALETKEAIAAETPRAVAQPPGYFIDAGGPGGVDSAGWEWLADQPYSDAAGYGYYGDSRVYENPLVNDPVLRTVRFGWFGYRFRVPDGTYRVTLIMAEIYPGAKTDLRVFSASAQGNPIFKDLCLINEAGLYGVVRREAVVTAIDGKIDVELTPTLDHANLNAITLEPIPPGVGLEKGHF